MPDNRIKDTDIDKEMKDTYSVMHAPESWKQETLLKMKEESMQLVQEIEVTEKKPNKKRNVIKISSNHRMRMVAGLAALCAAVLCFVFIIPKGTPYITSIEDGVYYDDIELKGGEIHFVSNRMAISITPNAGNGLAASDSSKENQTEVLLCDSGGIITFEKTQKVNLPELAEANWSYIGEQPIYVTVLKKEIVRYQAIYEKNGETYELIGEGVSQKEFVDELYQRIKK